jgi:hypothetical protein
MALPDIGRLWSFARKIEELLDLQTKTRESLQVIDERLRAIENRMTKLEAEQTQIITEARSAATAAASMLAGGIVSDTVTRMTRLEGRTEQLEIRRLPP